MYIQVIERDSYIHFKMYDNANKKLLKLFFADCNIFCTAELMSSLGYGDKQKLHVCFGSEFTQMGCNKYSVR